MYRIAKQFRFSAAHHLNHMPEGHQCAGNHGHNYIVEVILEADEIVRPQGWVRDYGDLKTCKAYIDGVLDHKDLNDILDQPTAENLARHLYVQFAISTPELAAVRVSETQAPDTWAEYSPGPLRLSDSRFSRTEPT